MTQSQTQREAQMRDAATGVTSLGSAEVQGAIMADHENKEGQVNMGTETMEMEDVKQCECCGKEAPLASFQGKSAFIPPWCKSCRKADPKGANRAYDRLRHQHRTLTDEQRTKKYAKQKVYKQRRRQAIKDAKDPVTALVRSLVTEYLESLDVALYFSAEQGYSEQHQHYAKAEIERLKAWVTR